MRKAIAPMPFSAFASHLQGVKVMYSSNRYFELHGQINHLFGSSDIGKDLLDEIIESFLSRSCMIKAPSDSPKGEGPTRCPPLHNFGILTHASLLTIARFWNTRPRHTTHHCAASQYPPMPHSPPLRKRRHRSPTRFRYRPRHHLVHCPSCLKRLREAANHAPIEHLKRQK